LTSERTYVSIASRSRFLRRRTAVPDEGVAVPSTLVRPRIVARMTARTETWLTQVSYERCPINGPHHQFGPHRLAVSDRLDLARYLEKAGEEQAPLQARCRCGYPFEPQEPEVRLDIPVLNFRGRRYRPLHLRGPGPSLLVTPVDGGLSGRDPLKAHLTNQTDVFRVRTSTEPCPVNGYHRSMSLLARCYVDPAREATFASGPAAYPKAFYWPTTCDCGYVFDPEEPKTRLCLPVLRLADGTEVNYREAPEGTYWDFTDEGDEYLAPGC
jgi:rubredoxin